MRKASDYFRENPFSSFAGRIGFDTGREDFVALGLHEKLRKETEEYLASKHITIRLLLSSAGGGKTWTLSWLWREFSVRPATIVVGIPHIELRGTPERGLLEGTFRAIRPDLKKILKKISEKHQFPQSLKGTPSEYVLHAMNDDATYSLLCGVQGRLPVLKDLRPPPITKTEGIMQLLLGLFKVLFAADFKYVLVLVDEAESLFSGYGRRDLMIFSDYIRNIFDEFQSDEGQTFPHVEILIAGTYHVLERVNPGLVGRQRDAADWALALVRRLSPPFSLTVLDGQKEVLKIAEYRIGVHRRHPSTRPYIPYDENAILYVWKNCYGSLGDFCLRLQEMYDLALREDAVKISLSYAKRAISRYQTLQATVT